MTYLYETSGGPDDAAWNTEIRRYAADGTQTWTKLLYPEATGDGSSYVESSPLGVGADGSLYVLQEEGSEAGAEGGSGSVQILRMSPEGTLFQGIPTDLDGFFGGRADGFAVTSTTQTFIAGQANTDAFYAVGLTSPNVACQTQPCPLPDAFSLFTR